MLRNFRPLVWMSVLFFAAAPEFSAYAQPFGMGTPPPTEVSHYRALGCPGGRYVFGQISDSEKDQFMLDTVTGRLWRIAESGEVGAYLRPIHYRTEKGGYSPLPEDVPTEGTKSGKE